MKPVGFKETLKSGIISNNGLGCCLMLEHGFLKPLLFHNERVCVLELCVRSLWERQFESRISFVGQEIAQRYLF